MSNTTSTSTVGSRKRPRETAEDEDFVLFEDFYDPALVECSGVQKKLRDSQERCAHLEQRCAYLEQVVENLSGQVQMLCNLCSMVATIVRR